MTADTNMTKPRSGARTPLVVHDSFGRTLTVAGAGEVASVQVEGRGERRHIQGFELQDADSMINVAHDLLERAFVTADCDEVAAAVEALRALAARDCTHPRTRDAKSGMPDEPYTVCEDCGTIVAGPEPF